MKKKRTVTPFSLAFLDIMFCGFGAVVLLVIILNGEVLQKREIKSEDLRGELSRAMIEEQLAFEKLSRIRKQVESVKLSTEKIKTAIVSDAKEQEKAENERRILRQKLATLEKKRVALEAEKAALQSSTQILLSRNNDKPQNGSRKIGFTGDGKRQYLTGLKLGGERTLILVDRSASMMDETIVNIVRRKLMSDKQKQQSPKWRRTIRSVNWLLANLQSDTSFQIFTFSTDARPAISGSGNQWMSSDDKADLESALKGIENVVPGGGTSLHRAFQVIQKLSPRPDSIILLTDGLPTQDLTEKNNRSVSSEDRLELFQSAVQNLPDNIPINTMLFPIEGDPLAAVSFWELAIRTKGSFITPAKDWP